MVVFAFFGVCVLALDGVRIIRCESFRLVGLHIPLVFRPFLCGSEVRVVFRFVFFRHVCSKRTDDLLRGHGGDDGTKHGRDPQGPRARVGFHYAPGQDPIQEGWFVEPGLSIELRRDPVSCDSHLSCCFCEEWFGVVDQTHACHGGGCASQQHQGGRPSHPSIVSHAWTRFVRTSFCILLFLLVLWCVVSFGMPWWRGTVRRMLSFLSVLPTSAPPRVSCVSMHPIMHLRLDRTCPTHGEGHQPPTTSYHPHPHPPRCLSLSPLIHLGRHGCQGCGPNEAMEETHGRERTHIHPRTHAHHGGVACSTSLVRRRDVATVDGSKHACVRERSNDIRGNPTNHPRKRTGEKRNELDHHHQHTHKHTNTKIEKDPSPSTPPPHVRPNATQHKRERTNTIHPLDTTRHDTRWRG